MSLSSAQLQVLRVHGGSGDRIAYCEALSGFGYPYGALDKTRS